MTEESGAPASGPSKHKVLNLDLLMGPKATAQTSIGTVYLYSLRASDISEFRKLRADDPAERVREFLPCIASLSERSSFKEEREPLPTELAAQLTEADLDALGTAYASPTVLGAARDDHQCSLSERVGTTLKSACKPAQHLKYSVIRTVFNQITLWVRARLELGDSYSGAFAILANPPFGVEWKPEKDNINREHNEFGFKGRFGPGLPRINDGALLFLMHMISKMRPAPKMCGDGSRIAVVFNGSPLFTGDAGSGESNIRRWIIENDMLEAVIGLPDQLFYNTGIYTYVWIVTNRKRPERAGKIQLINATEFARKMKKSLGDKRKRLGDGTDGSSTEADGSPNHIAVITRLYADFQNDVRMTLGDIETNIDPKRDQTKSLCVSKIFDNREFGYLKITVERPLRLNFAVTDERIKRFQTSPFFESLAISLKRKNKAKIEEEILEGKAAQAAILAVLQAMKPAFAGGQLVKDRKIFEGQLSDAFKSAGLTLDLPLKTALLAAGGLGEKDPSAEICRDKKGNPEPDADLRDTENVPLPDGIELPLPLDYESKKNKGKVDVEPLLKVVREHCEDYLKAEVLPYRPDAWIEHSKIKVGYEIPFNRHFYEYEPPRSLDAIEADIEKLEGEIMAMLKEVTA